MLVKSRLELVSWDEELLEKFPIEHPLAKASVRYKVEQMS
ncbi:hypothetical protein A5881_001381 [Enterococcus termitis]|nr:hypothetical protein A5881_002892 [Enterococcus termitis]